ncbi:MAG TPA: helix-turn-helix transcriptional regulator [Ferruginibacter sp.]|nr:helix-turn-helix transcriptional regulator [Ferruginibacter sp.]
MAPKKIPGEAIRKLRHYKGFKQYHAGEKIGISQQAYSKMVKSAHVKPHKIHQAIKAFGCSIEDFEQLNGYPPPPEIIL